MHAQPATTFTSDDSSTHATPHPAVVLLSGGLDSATTLAIANQQGFACHALSFDYGQRHRVELQAAGRIAAALGVVSHRQVTIDLRAFGGSALTDDIAVPKDRLEAEHNKDEEKALSTFTQARQTIPITYVPARNTIFLSYALALAEVLESRDLFIGVNAVDYSGYPDCRPEFIAAFARMANLATRQGVESPADKPYVIHTPLIDMPKTDIIRRGLTLGVDYGLTHSCYDPDELDHPCRHCDACLLRQQAFKALGMTDPLLTK